MRHRTTSRFYFVAVSLLLIVVCVGWYASENFSGKLGQGAMSFGDASVWPGRMVDAILSGNLHGGFGGWWSGSIRIVVSWLVWSSPLILFWRCSKHARDKGGVHGVDA